MNLDSLFSLINRSTDLGRERHFQMMESHSLILKRMELLMASIDELAAKVAANTSVVNSALALISGLADKIKSANLDPVKTQALIDELDASDQALASAVAANTVADPAAPQQQPAPTPTPPDTPLATPTDQPPQ